MEVQLLRTKYLAFLGRVRIQFFIAVVDGVGSRAGEICLASETNRRQKREQNDMWIKQLLKLSESCYALDLVLS